MSEDSEGLSDVYESINEAIDEAGITPEGDATDNDASTHEASDNNEAGGTAGRTEGGSSEPSAEDLARQSGWVPKDDYRGNANTWVDYDEFNRRAPLFEKINEKNKQIDKLNHRLDLVVDHMKNVEQSTRDKTIQELKEQQRQTVEDGDADAYDKIGETIEEIEKQEGPNIDKADENDTGAKPSDAAPADQAPPAVKAFAARNDWFEKDAKMTRYMLAATEDMVRTRGLNLDEAIDLAEAEVKQVFAAKFKNPNKDRPSSVLSGNREVRPKGKAISDLTSEQKTVWYSLKGTMSEEEFLTQLENIA
jgi:TolA-binding protein